MTMDSALWITWYDLAEARRDEYLAWLHGRYAPALLARAGVLWAAHYASVEKEQMVSTHPEFVTPSTRDATVPAGHRYIFIAAARDAHVFANPLPGSFHAALPPSDRAMLALRIGERVNVMVEAARIEGPAALQYRDGMAPAPCIQLGSFNCDWRDEDEMLEWYATWRMAAMRTVPGCIRTRKLASVSGWAKHAILYEFESVEGRNRHYPAHEAQNVEMKAWSSRMVKKLAHAPGSPNLAARLWPPVAP